MTQVLARREGNRCYLSATGHATGSVEVCAGVSAILYSLAGYLENAAMARELEISVLRLESGDAVIEFEADGQAREAYEMAVIGLIQMAQMYPQYLVVSDFRVF